MEKFLSLKEGSLIGAPGGPSLAAELLRAQGHWGRPARLRRASARELMGSRQGVDLVDLRVSAAVATAAAPWLAGSGELGILARSRAAIAAAEALLAALAQGEGRAARPWLGRWKPGALTNWQAGAWSARPPAAVLALGPGHEIALAESRALGIPALWIADTDADPRAASRVCRVNASRPEPMAIAGRAALGIWRAG